MQPPGAAQAEVDSWSEVERGSRLGLVCGDGGNSTNGFQDIWGLACMWDRREGAVVAGSRGGDGTLRRGPSGWVCVGEPKKGCCFDDPEWETLDFLGKYPVGKEVRPRGWSDN